MQQDLCYRQQISWYEPKLCLTKPGLEMSFKRGTGNCHQQQWLIDLKVSLFTVDALHMYKNINRQSHVLLHVLTYTVMYRVLYFGCVHIHDCWHFHKYFNHFFIIIYFVLFGKQSITNQKCIISWKKERFWKKGNHKYWN